MKHILVIFFDQMRYDAIGANGNPYIHTPALDALAKDSVRFERCMTPSPVCVPARLSMLAGQYPARTGNSNNNAVLQYEGEGFYKKITDAGYDSFSVGKMHHVWDRFGKLGFKKRLCQEAQTNDDYLAFIQNSPYHNVFDLIGQRSEMYYVPQVSQLPMEYHPTTWIGDNSVEFLDGCDPEKDNIFLFSSIHQPHPPLSPPAPWNKIYRGYDGIEPYVPEDYEFEDFSGVLYDRFSMERLGISEMDIKRIRNFYYACVTYADYQVSRIIDKLKEKGMYDDTLIVVASDHGEMLGDYNMVGKRTLVDGASRIPFMIKMPGVAPGVRDDACSLVDLAPTLLSYAGIEYDKDEYDGVDLFAEKHTEVYTQYDSGVRGLYMVTTDKDKLAFNGGEKKYYYFKDKDESKNRYKEFADDDTVKALKEKLDRYVASDRGEATPTSSSGKRSEPPFGLAPIDTQATREKELARIPEPYRQYAVISKSKPKKKKEE